MIKVDQRKERLFLHAGFVVLLAIFCTGIQAQTAAVNAFPPMPNPDRIVLNVTRDPSTSIAVNWRTCDTVREGFLEIMPVTADPRAVDKALRKQAKSEAFKFEDIAANYHSVTVSGLRPKTLYMYRVGQGAH